MRNSNRKREIREPSAGVRWSEADGELAFELPAEGLLGLRKFGRNSRRKKGKDMDVSGESTMFREVEWYRAFGVSTEYFHIPQRRFCVIGNFVLWHKMLQEGAYERILCSAESWKATFFNNRLAPQPLRALYYSLFPVGAA